MDNQSFEDRVALVCGGSDGIGLSTAVQLASKGCEIVLLGRSLEKLTLQKTKLDGINNKDNTIMSIDFSDLDILEAKVSSLMEHKLIHIIINNCGGPAPGSLLDSTVQTLSDTFKLHVLASHVLAKLIVPSMKEAGYGRIINIVSTSVRQPIVGLGVSNTIRGAMASWAKTLSYELAPFGLTVNNILPGTTKTGRLSEILVKKQANTGKSAEEVKAMMLDQIPMGRFAEVEEIANAITFLASKEASYITGASLQVDGGKIKSI